MDIDTLRAETPALPEVIHFNAASSGLVPRSVLAAMEGHLHREAELAPHEAGLAAGPMVEELRGALARLIGAGPGEVALLTGSSQAWNAAYAALPRLRPGDRVLVGRHEWGGNVMTLAQDCARAGATLEVIPAGSDGRVDLTALEAMIDESVRLIVLTWAPAHLGILEPAAEVGRIARAASVPYFLDGAQAVGMQPCDVAGLGCDVLAFPGRKLLRGPKGTGVLYVREGFLQGLVPQPLNVRASGWAEGAPVLRADAGRFESNEFAYAPLLGLEAAVALCRALGVEAIRQETLERVAALRAALAELPEVKLCETGTPETHITTFTHARLTPVEIVARLRGQGITANAIAPAYGPLAMQAPVCRLSVSYLISSADIAAVAGALAAL